MTARTDVVYFDDETYEQKQVPEPRTLVGLLKQKTKKNQLVGNSSLGVHTYLHTDMPGSIPKGGT